jgi:hypothetical protein
MRDIRSDLQERATLVDEQIRAVYSHFEKTVEQLKDEHEARVGDLKSGLSMIGQFMEFEERYFMSDSARPNPRRWLGSRTFSCVGSMRSDRCRERDF